MNVYDHAGTQFNLQYQTLALQPMTRYTEHPNGNNKLGSTRSNSVARHALSVVEAHKGHDSFTYILLYVHGGVARLEAELTAKVECLKKSRVQNRMPTLPQLIRVPLDNRVLPKTKTHTHKKLAGCDTSRPHLEWSVYRFRFHGRENCSPELD